MGTPIINPPQSAILGMHGINKVIHFASLFFFVWKKTSLKELVCFL